MAPLIELGAGFDMDLTARENVYLNGALLGYNRSQMEAQYEDIVNFSELGEFMNVPVKNFSSGMVSRLAFAIATIGVPDILICDEVLSVGDFRFQEKCEQLIEAYGLTEREGEIMTLFAKGRNLPYIQEMLFLSKSTVSTHRQHIYAKLNIHSQQELIDCVQNFEPKDR